MVDLIIAPGEPPEGGAWTLYEVQRQDGEEWRAVHVGQVTTDELEVAVEAGTYRVMVLDSLGGVTILAGREYTIAEDAGRILVGVSPHRGPGHIQPPTLGTIA